jgi:hypothetical protein
LLLAFFAAFFLFFLWLVVPPYRLENNEYRCELHLTNLDSAVVVIARDKDGKPLVDLEVNVVSDSGGNTVFTDLKGHGVTNMDGDEIRRILIGDSIIEHRWLSILRQIVTGPKEPGYIVMIRKK